MCSTCNEVRTVEHLFLYCESLKRFWARFVMWWNRIADGHDVLLDSVSDKVILFNLLPSRKHCLLNIKFWLLQKSIYDGKL